MDEMCCSCLPLLCREELHYYHPSKLCEAAANRGFRRLSAPRRRDVIMNESSPVEIARHKHEDAVRDVIKERRPEPPTKTITGAFSHEYRSHARTH